MTERLFNAFKSKTIPIYYGCYNIESHVPSSLFIDYRECNKENLINRLVNMSKQEYIDMTEKAYEWVQTCKIGNIEDLETIIKELP